MAAEPQLTPACELAFAVAREGAGASPALEPPVAMRSFLDAPQLPRRALTVAQRVLQEDPQFRARVAERASEDAVGRVGWLWLTRPQGWEAEFSELTGRVPARLLAAPALPPRGEAPPPRGGGSDPAVVAGDPLLLSDLERELDALRSLVTRVASEQQAAPAVVQQLEADIEHRDAELALAREEREALVVALEAALAERDEARGRVAEVGRRLEQVGAQLDDVTVQRIGLQREVQRLTEEHQQAAAAHRGRMDELIDGLRLVEQQRDELALALEQAVAGRAEIDGRGVAPVAVEAWDEIGDSVLPSLSSASEAARLLGSAIDEALCRLGLLQATLGSLPGAVEATEASGLTQLEPEAIQVPSPPVGVEDLRRADDLPGDDAPWTSQHDVTADQLDADQLGLDVGTGGGTGIEDDADWELSDLLAMYSTGAEPGPAATTPAEIETVPHPAGVRDDGERARLVHHAAEDVAPASSGTGVDQLDWDPLLEAPREAWTNLGERATRRRCPDVPEELRADPLAVARFLVAVPDVIVIIDGDAVASLGWPTLGVADQRDALVSYLADLAGTTGAAPDVVFDARIDDDQALPTSETVRVRLTAPGVTAARAVAELIDTYPVDWPVVVVADDGELVGEAAHRGASTLSNDQLLDLFIAQ